MIAAEVMLAKGKMPAAEAMIEVKNLTVQNSEKTILDGLNLTIDPGDRIGVIGASGIGKSTLAFALLGEIGSGLRITEGGIRYQGQTLLENGKFRCPHPIRQLRQMTGHLDQDPASSLNPKHRIAFILTELSAVRGDERRRRIEETFAVFGLPFSEAFLQRYPHELSGGQRRRVALARILLRNPKLLILDEPTADLDAETRDDVLLLVSQLIRKIKPAVLVISHDFEVIQRLTDRCYALEDGRLMPFRVPQIRLSEPAKPLRQPVHRPSSRPVLFRAIDLSAQAPGLQSATVQNLSFDLCEHEALAITGPSGAGKTTLLRTLLGLWPRTGGELEYRGQALAPSFRKRSAEQLQALGWVPQDPRSSFNPAIPLDKAFRRIEKPALPISEVLQLVHVSERELINRFPDQLSGGQIQRLAIARAVLAGAQVLLLDEVTSSLDSKSRDSICELLCQLKASYALLTVTHDPVVAERVCDREIKLNGMVKSSGIPLR